ncbi:MAG: hypothetical protein QXN71_00955 [Candidatus Aenigmatarchaeota archaeon]
MKRVNSPEDCIFWKHCINHGLLALDNCIYKTKIDNCEVECPVYKSIESSKRESPFELHWMCQKLMI